MKQFVPAVVLASRPLPVPFPHHLRWAARHRKPRRQNHTVRTWAVGSIAILAILLFFASPRMVQATQIPIAIGGFNQDFVVGAGESYAFSPSGPLTGTMNNGAGATSGTTWYGQGQNVSASATGLPTGIYTSESDPNTTLQLASFTGLNTVLLDSGNTSATIALATPAIYSTLSLFGSSSNGEGFVDYTLNFANGDQQSGTLGFEDWFGGYPNPIFPGVAISTHGYMDGSGYLNVNTPNPGPLVFQDNIALVNPGSQLDSIALTYDSGTFGYTHTGIFALSGTLVSVPEPTYAVALAGLCGMGLIGFALRRNRRQELICDSIRRKNRKNKGDATRGAANNESRRRVRLFSMIRRRTSPARFLLVV